MTVGGNVMPAGKVNVTVSKGWVTLKGEVEWNYQRYHAERAVRPIKGVNGVSKLALRHDPGPHL